MIIKQLTDDHSHMGVDMFKGISAGDLELSFISARSNMFWLSAPMNAIVIVGASRGRGNGNKTSLRHGFVQVSHMLCSGSCSVSSKKLPQSISLILFEALGSCLIVCLKCLGPASLVARSGFRKSASTLIMPRLRQRMLSRRGTSRRAPSRPTSLSPSNDFFSSHHPRTRSGRGRSLWPSQFLEPSSSRSSSSPSFGSTIFTFNCNMNRPRITAHVSVLFLEEAQEGGESSAPQEGPGLVYVLNPGSLRAMEIPAHNVNDMEMEPTAPS